MDEIERLTQENKKLKALLREAADDIRCDIENRYSPNTPGSRQPHNATEPSLRPRIHS
jgi:hypothetical protein